MADDAFDLDTFGTSGLPPMTDWAAERDRHLAALAGPGLLSPAERQEHATLALVAAVSLLVGRLGMSNTLNLASGALAAIGGIFGGRQVAPLCSRCGNPIVGGKHDCPFGDAPAVCPRCGARIEPGTDHVCMGSTSGGAP